LPGRGAWTQAYQGFSESDAIGAAPDARDSTDDRKTAPGTSGWDLLRAHRHCRGGCRKRKNGASANCKARGKDTIAELAIAEARKEIEHFCDLGARVIDQARRRVLNGEQVPTAVGRGGRARQQPHEGCGPGDATIIAQT